MDPRFSAIRDAYEGVESSFRSEQERERYRAAALEKSGVQAAWIDTHSECGPALEVGCGNGRLLIALQQRRAIAGGTGLDIARSRIDFAAEWALDLGLDELSFAAGDALAYAGRAGHFTLGLCVTGAFGYFDAHAPGSGAQLLHMLHRHLAPQATLVLELYLHPQLVADAAAKSEPVRSWYELPDEDPWRFYLSEVSMEGNVLVHRKAFVHRTNGTIDEGRTERAMIYSPEAVESMCRDAGFVDVRLLEGWSDDAYRGGDVLVVLARRESGAEQF